MKNKFFEAMDMESFLREPHIVNYIGVINSYLDKAVSDYFPMLRDMSRYAIRGGGKRIRPLLAVLSCEAVGGDPKLAIPVAVAYELAHTAALIQDDVLDRSPKRRGKPSVWKLYSLGEAILLSDLFLFEIYGVIAEYENLNLPPKRLYRLLRLIRESAKNAAWGELLDLELAKKSYVTVEEYLEMIKFKTGSLLAAPAAAGAIVAGASESYVQALYLFAEKIGMAYQIQDDILDVVGSEKEMGKPIFLDLKAGKKSVVLIHAMQNATGDERRFLESIMFKNLSKRDVEKVRRIIDRLGSVVYARELSFKLAEEGRRYLRLLKPSMARDALLKLSYVAVNRYA
ncbi:polyprenyl synthetase family protein [Candidatus Bathyarchaeota archaeon]|nr:polyprenyl synthetase family protein [Candidatus Bathyarchaeota archaeon]